MADEKLIASVEAGTPPEWVRTPEDWRRWRAEEDARMLREVHEQIAADIERLLNDPTVH